MITPVHGAPVLGRLRSFESRQMWSSDDSITEKTDRLAPESFSRCGCRTGAVQDSTGCSLGRSKKGVKSSALHDLARSCAVLACRSRKSHRESGSENEHYDDPKATRMGALCGCHDIFEMAPFQMKGVENDREPYRILVTKYNRGERRFELLVRMV